MIYCTRFTLYTENPVMKTSVLAADLGLCAAQASAKKKASKHIAWWTRQIAKAKAKGETRCTNRRSGWWLFNSDYDDHYVAALQSLLPRGFRVTGHSISDVECDTWTEVSWK